MPVLHRAGTKFCILPFPWEKVIISGSKKYLSTAASVADPHHVDADPDPAFHLDAKPEPDNTFHSDADLDPDPTLKLDPDPTTIFLADRDPASQNDADPEHWQLHCIKKRDRNNYLLKKVLMI